MWQCFHWWNRGFCAELKSLRLSSQAFHLTTMWPLSAQASHHADLCSLVEQRVPCWALSPASFCTSLPSYNHMAMCSLVELRVPCWALGPASFPHQLFIWLPHGNVFTGGTEGSMLSSKPHLFPSPAFHLTTTWQCVHWWNWGFHAEL